MHRLPSVKYRPEIDGLRGISILAVLAYHAFPKFCQGGFLGVDIFFVISGFLITSIIIKELQRGDFSYCNFYSRRIKRIFPALILVLGTCLLAGWILLYSDEYKFIGKHSFAGAGMFGNFVSRLEAGYFDIAAKYKPLLHLWSLGVEEQFYLIWPICLGLIFKIKRFHSLIIFSLLSISFIFNFYYFEPESKDAFFLPITRFWELLSGAILATWTRSQRENSFQIWANNTLCVSDKFKFWLREVIFTLGLLLTLISVFNIPKSPIGEIYNIKIVIGSVLVILVGDKSFLAKILLANKVIIFVGLISYPLYLWHLPLLSFVQIIIPDSLSMITTFYLLTISFILATITYLYLEKKIWEIEHRLVPVYLFFLLSLVGYAGHQIYNHNGYPHRFPQQEIIIKTKTGGQKIDPQCLKLFGDEFNDYCLSQGSGRNYIFILGDSLTEGISNAYSEKIASFGYHVVTLGMGGCPLLVPENQIKLAALSIIQEEKRRSCNFKIEKILSIVKKNNPKGVIFVNNGWNNGWNSRSSFYEVSMNNMIQQFPKEMPKVWVLQNPRIPFELNNCLPRPLLSTRYSDNCSFSISYNKQFFNGYEKMVSQIKNRFPNLLIIDPASLLCKSGQCQIVVNGKFFYRDRRHLSQSGAKYLGQNLPLGNIFPRLQ